MDAARLATAVNRAVLLRACPETVPIPEGWVVRRSAVPLVQHTNTIRLRETITAARLTALAELWQPDLPHRRVAIETPEGLEAAEEARLLERGWFRERVVLMTLPAARIPRGGDARGREVDEPTLRRLEMELFAEANVGPLAHPELPRQLSDAQAQMRAASPTRRFAAGEDGELSAMATLFLDADVAGARVAQLETVGTRASRRGRGLAGAAVGAALDAARDWGADHVVVVADAEDWPQVWYAGLGFSPRTRHVAYVRVGR